MLRRGDGRPSRLDVERAALDLLQRHGSLIISTARRYAATPEDAEDAYQRGLEILLTKAPTTREDELLPWLRTVVKHEAFALRRQRERAVPASDEGEPSAAEGAPPQDHAERFERLRQGAEALHALKPQEVRALLLRAEGYSYKEICRITGWTYTKVNRCLTEGRRAFLRRIAGIEAGAECERLAPQLSALADGEASAEDLRELRPHLRTCLVCRSRLREFREVPARVAAVMPAVAAVAGPGDGSRSLLETAVGTVQERAARWGDRAGSVAELVSGHKAAAVAASAAALAGGGAATVEQGDRHPVRTPPAELARPAAELDVRLPAAAVATPPAKKSAPAVKPAPAAVPTPAPPPAPRPSPAREFDPSGAATQARASDFEPSGAAVPASGSGGEFGP